MKRIMIFMSLIVLFSAQCFAAGVLGVGGEKDESDVLLQAYSQAVKTVNNLQGLQDAKKVAVLVVRQGFEGSSSFGGRADLGIRPKSYVYLPRGTAAVAESHNPMVEDLIIDQLLERGVFEIVEISDKYYGALGGNLNREINNDLSLIVNIGEAVGADTIIIGSSAGSIWKYVSKKSFFYTREYFVANIKLNLRTVDVGTNEVTSTVLGSGSDSVRISKSLRKERAMLVGAIFVGGASLATD